MDKIQLLDCTLRDGCYIVDGDFGRNAIGGIIKRLQDAHVEIIECGWLKDMPHKTGSAYYHVPSDLEQYLIAGKNPDATYVAMIDYNRYDLTQLPEYDGKSIDAIRVVFPKDEVDKGLSLARPIREKGYRVYFQAANTLGYSDQKLLELIEKVNEIEPEGISIVDTFGAMYPYDLRHILDLFTHNLKKTIKLGLHSHNNLQLSFANAMEFVDILSGQDRKIIIDSSLCGMGRGAGNACTELVMGYLNKRHDKYYDIDIILDTIDIYMNRYMNNYEWGYSIPYYISGAYCAHVNNITYLLRTHKTRAKDMKNIIERLEPETRLVYDYDNLDKVYVDYQSREVNDEAVREKLKNDIKGKTVTLIVPGKSAVSKRQEITEAAAGENSVVIGVNALVDGYKYDYLFFSNPVRYDYALEQGMMEVGAKIIVTSNIKQVSNQEYIVNYNSLLMRGWKLFEISIMMVLELLSVLEPEKVDIAGWDGYDIRKENYSDPNMEVNLSQGSMEQFNSDLKEMLADFRARRKIRINFITESRFDTGVDR